ncbi:MAG: HAD family hydrolase [Pygmaiobacter massiliensis]|nr:HAD family hydrolase [Pygmaiobacter massiliensis]
MTEPDHTWVETAYHSIHTLKPDHPVTLEQLMERLRFRCLPWWCGLPDTRALAQQQGAWWRFVEEKFSQVYQEYGFLRQEADAMARQLRPALLNPANNRLKQDAVTVLSTLQKRGYRQYILSNNYPELPQVVTALGLDPYLSGVFVSGLVGYDKPDRRMFEYALQQANTSPENAVMIGDNPEDDMAGAKRAGLATIGVGRAADCADADVSCKELASILQVLT